VHVARGAGHVVVCTAPRVEDRRVVDDAGQAERKLLLSAARQLQDLLPGAVLAGGTAAGHRRSELGDHVLTELRERFDAVLLQLEAAAGWRTERAHSGPC